MLQRMATSMVAQMLQSAAFLLCSTVFRPAKSRPSVRWSFLRRSSKTGKISQNGSFDCEVGRCTEIGAAETRCVYKLGQTCKNVLS